LASTVFEFLLYLFRSKYETHSLVQPVIERISSDFGSIELTSSDSDASEGLSRSTKALRSATIEVEGARESVLAFLVREGLVEEKEFERIIICPVCGSPKVRVELRCPYCGSTKIEPQEIVQHTICGYTAPKKSFVAGSKLFCPNCKTFINERDLKVLGRSFFCESCGRIFRTPAFRFMCLNYNTTLHKPRYYFEPIEAKMKALMGYAITEKGENALFEGELLVEALREALSSDARISVVSGGEARRILREKFKLSEIEFLALFAMGEKVAVTDVVGKDPLPALFKAGLLASLKIPYIVIAHPDSVRVLTEAEKTYQKFHALSLSSFSIDRFKELLISVLEEVQK